MCTCTCLSDKNVKVSGDFFARLVYMFETVKLIQFHALRSDGVKGITKRQEPTPAVQVNFYEPIRK